MAKTKRIAIVVLSIMLVLATLFCLTSISTAKAEVTPVFKIVDGASIRLTGGKVGEDDITNGIRFQVQMDSNTAKSIDGEDTKLYVLIAPTSYDLTDESVILSNESKWIEINKDTIYKTSSGLYQANAVICNLSADFFGTTFKARAIIETSADFIYSDMASEDGAERSMYDVVNSAVLDTSSNASAIEDIIGSGALKGYKAYYGTATFPVKATTQEQYNKFVDKVNEGKVDIKSVNLNTAKDLDTNTKKITKEGVEKSVEKTLNTVTFMSEGKVVKVVGVKDNEKVTAPTSPTKTGYTFVSWKNGDDAFDFNTEITSSITLTANFEVNKYTVTFKNGDEVLQETDVDYGTVASYSGETPTKTADAQYTYIFTGWDKELVAVTENVTYTATFDSTINKYTVTWKNGTTTLAEEEYEYGATPSYKGETPQKQADEQYTYTFKDFGTIATVTCDVEYTATYTETKNKYTVIFKNGDEELQKTDVEYGTIPTYSGETPIKVATAQYTYAFTGWDTTPVAVVGEATYTAQFSETLRSYTIKFVNYDGTELQSGLVAYGTIPTYSGETPTKASDNTYTYTFKCWDSEVVTVVGDATYTATYTETYIDYTITFDFANGTDNDVKTYHYGDTVTVPADPTKSADNTYTYAFNGWDSEVVTVVGDATYTATYTETINKYTVTVVSNNANYGTVDVETVSDVPYGTVITTSDNTITVNGTVVTATATASTAQCVYAFSDWTNGTATVEGAITVTANFTQHTHDYTVDKGNGVYACSCGEEITNPLYGKNLVFSNILPSSSSSDAILGSDTYVTATSMARSEKDSKVSYASKDTLRDDLRIEYNDGYEEYYFAFKSDVSGAIRETSYAVKKDVWYLVKLTKNDDAEYKGFDMFVKELYADDSTFTQIYNDSWRVGNHTSYKGMVTLVTLLAIVKGNTTENNYAEEYHISTTGLYGKVPAQADILTGDVQVSGTKYLLSGVTESSETYKGKKVYTVSNVDRSGYNSSTGNFGNNTDISNNKLWLDSTTVCHNNYYFAVRFNAPCYFTYVTKTLANANVPFTFSVNMWYIIRLSKVDSDVVSCKVWKLSYSTDGTTFTDLEIDNSQGYRLGDHANYNGKAYFSWFLTMAVSTWKTGSTYSNTFTVDATDIYADSSITHTYVQKSDATNHWQECSVCGDKINEEAHTSDDIIHYSDDKTTEYNLCTVCGAKINETAHTHTSDDIIHYSDDKTTEYNLCTDCGATINEKAHTHTSDDIIHYNNDKTTEYNLCTDCGATINEKAHTHSYTVDKGNGVYACACGEEFESPFAGLTLVNGNILISGVSGNSVTTSAGSMFGQNYDKATDQVTSTSNPPNVINTTISLSYLDGYEEYYFAFRADVTGAVRECGNGNIANGRWYIVKLTKIEKTAKNYGGFYAWMKELYADDSTYIKLNLANWRVGNYNGYNGTAALSTIFSINTTDTSEFDVYMTGLYGLLPTTPFDGLEKDSTKFWRSSGTQTVNNASDKSTTITITTTEVTDANSKYTVGGTSYTTYQIAGIPSSGSLGSSYKSYSTFGNLGSSLNSTTTRANSYYFAVKFNVDVQLNNATTVTFSKDTWYIIKMEKKMSTNGGWTMYYKTKIADKFVRVGMDAWKLGDHANYNGKAYYTTIFQINTVNGDSTYTAYVTNYYRDADSFVGLTKDETQFWRSSGYATTETGDNAPRITTTEVTDASSKYTVSGTSYTTYQIAGVPSLAALSSGVSSSYSSFGNIGSCLDSTVAEASNYYFAVKFNVDVKTSNSTSFTFKGNTWYIIKLEKKATRGWTMYYRTEEMENFVNVGFDAWRLGDNESLLGKAYYSTFLQMTTVDSNNTTYTAYVTNYYTDIT